MLVSPSPDQAPDPWDFETLKACEYCQGALHVLPPCPTHGATPLNHYIWVQSQRNPLEWQCGRCGETGKNQSGSVPFTHFCPDQQPKLLDLSSLHKP